jgi:hypothetical protein
MQYELVKRYICRGALLGLECLGKFCSTSRGKDEIFFACVSILVKFSVKTNKFLFIATPEF